MSKVFQMRFGDIYKLYEQKVAKKGRTQAELGAVIKWLTSYGELPMGKSLEQLFADAPRINPNAKLITGTVCGCRVEEVADPLMQKIRWMDKLVDELAKGWSLDKIMRKGDG